MLDFETIIKMLFGTFVRNFLTIAGAWLAAHGATADQAAAFISNGFDLVIGLLVIAVSILFSYISKKKALLTPPPVKK